MRLTTAMKNAGIVLASNLRNGNGSYTCKVVLNDIDTKDDSTNFRKFDKRHMEEISGENYFQQAVRNPILVFNDDHPTLRSVDGRHTINMLRGIAKRWTCDIHINLPPSAIYRLFYELTQNSKRMGAWDAYHSACEAKLDFATDIRDALIRHKLGEKDMGGSFTPLEDSWSFGILDEFLSVMKHWRTNKVARLNPFQRGLIDFIRHNKPSAQTLATLVKVNPTDIGEMARKPGKQRPDRKEYADAFLDVVHLQDSGKIAA